MTDQSLWLPYCQKGPPEINFHTVKYGGVEIYSELILRESCPLAFAVKLALFLTHSFPRSSPIFVRSAVLKKRLIKANFTVTLFQKLQGALL